MQKLTLIVATLFFAVSSAFAVQKAVVIVPVADLRSDQSLPEPGKSDDKQQTQLLFGETVEVVKSSGDWVYVNAIEQPSFKYRQRWEGYPGWILKSALRFNSNTLFDGLITTKWVTVRSTVNSETISLLPLGSRIRILPVQENPYPGVWINLLQGQTGWIPFGSFKPIPRSCPSDCRARILETATLLLGDTYVWGGLSPSDETHKIRLTGVDCSGLTHLSYRVNGVTIPRDSMEQYMKAEKIQRKDLKPADLIFSSKADNPQKITHVALYAGGDQIIEAPQTGMMVRKVSFKEKYGADMASVESGTKVGDRVIYFGRLLKN